MPPAEFSRHRYPGLTLLSAVCFSVFADMLNQNENQNMLIYNIQNI